MYIIIIFHRKYKRTVYILKQKKRQDPFWFPKVDISLPYKGRFFKVRLGKKKKDGKRTHDSFTK